MLKAINVVKWVIISIILFYSISLFSQKTLEGKFYVEYDLKEFGTSYEFTTDGIFKYSHSGHLGLIEYGQGHYSIIKNSLILNYDLTELEENSYHKYKIYKNSTDSVQIKFNINNMKNIPLEEVSIVGDLKSGYGVISNHIGEAQLKFKKMKGSKKIEISGLCCESYSLIIDTELNYMVELFLRDNFNNPIGIKNEIQKFKILDLSNDQIKIENKGGIKIWKKENSY